VKRSTVREKGREFGGCPMMNVSSMNNEKGDDAEEREVTPGGGRKGRVAGNRRLLVSDSFFLLVAYGVLGGWVLVGGGVLVCVGKGV
jgi:hypothetical protein